MTSNEYTGNESAIMAQLKSIGIPYESDLKLASLQGDGVIYVHSYIRKDGTKVSGYWRSLYTSNTEQLKLLQVFKQNLLHKKFQTIFKRATQSP